MTAMRSSDRTFLLREVLPVLRQTAPISPDAQEAYERLFSRLKELTADTDTEPSPAASRTQLVRNTFDPSYERVRFSVDGYLVPYLSGVTLTPTDDHPEERTCLFLGDGANDEGFGFDAPTEEVKRWAWFLANAMAYAAGRTAHGPQSYVRNPHGRTGAGDPPPGELDTSSYSAHVCHPDCELQTHPHPGPCMRLIQRPPTITTAPPEVFQDAYDPEIWRVESFGSDGECFIVAFSGPDAEQRARHYAAG